MGGPGGFSIKQRRGMALSDAAMVAAFYRPVHDLADLLVASDVQGRRAGGASDAWRADGAVPAVLQKLWADLYELRKKLQRHEGPTADPALLAGCMHFYRTLDELAPLVRPELAAAYLESRAADPYRPAFLPAFLPAILRPALAGAMLRRHRRDPHTLAEHLRARIRDALHSRLRT